MKRKVHIQNLSVRLQNLQQADGLAIASALRGALPQVVGEIASAHKLALRVNVPAEATATQIAQAIAHAMATPRKESR